MNRNLDIQEARCFDCGQSQYLNQYENECLICASTNVKREEDMTLTEYLKL